MARWQVPKSNDQTDVGPSGSRSPEICLANDDDCLLNSLQQTQPRARPCPYTTSKRCSLFHAILTWWKIETAHCRCCQPILIETRENAEIITARPIRNVFTQPTSGSLTDTSKWYGTAAHYQCCNPLPAVQNADISSINITSAITA